jgi:hypothetical protein
MWTDLAANRQRSWVQTVIVGNRQRIVQFLRVSAVNSFATYRAAV